MINKLSVSLVYIIASSALFLRKFPANGDNENFGSLLAFISGPLYKLVTGFQYWNEKIILSSIISLAIWMLGLIGVLLMKNNIKFWIVFTITWLSIGLWNVYEFAISGI